jgi:molybdopterin-guanine dinucleotide biosynthesis protein A
MMDANGFVTAGGRSSRMGKDKAWLEIGGQSMIERVIAALTPVTASVSIIANGPEYSRLGLPVFADTQEGIGPLEAIRTALTNTRLPRAVLVGCDLPFVTNELFKFLVSIGGDYQVILPVGPDGKLETLCAIYCKEMLPMVSDLIESGERKVSVLFERVATRFVVFDEIRHIKGSEMFFENVNTPADYARAIEAALRIIKK